MNVDNDMHLLVARLKEEVLDIAEQKI